MDTPARTSNDDPRPDNRVRRGQETRRLLMRAAETLIADKGLEHVSIRQILDEARQSNASALQYHFGSLSGLISAIQAERSDETRAKRAELMAALRATTREPDLRQLCGLMVRPAFELARTHRGFRRYVKAFGHQLVLIETSAASVISRRGGGGESGIELLKLLKRALPHLSQPAFQQRMDFAVRLCASAMYAQARRTNAFRGKQAEFFIEGLIDALVGLLSGPETRHVDG